MLHDYAVRIAEEILTFIKDAYSPPGGFQLREETLTESILVSIKRDFANTSIFSKPTTKQESKGGHDWTWLIQTQHGVGLFRVQAKKLYDDGKYQALDHSHRTTVAGVTPVLYEAQVERLLNVSHNIGAAPIYAFYNGEFGAFNSSVNANVSMNACCRSTLQRVNNSSPDYSPMSITLADAHWVRSKMTLKSNGKPTIPSVTDINGAAWPWECLFRCQNLGGGSGPDSGPTGGTPNDPDGTAPDTNQGVVSDSGGPVKNLGDAPPTQSTPNEGFVPARLSYMRKLAYALQTGEVPKHTTGFSTEEPSTLTNLKAAIKNQQADQFEGTSSHSENLFANIEPHLKVSEKPDFYVYIDLRSESSEASNLTRQMAPIVSPEHR